MVLFESGPPWAALATYNGERSRGIVHTPEWVAAMVEEQARFDAFQEQRLVADGWVEIAPGMWVGGGADGWVEIAPGMWVGGGERRGRWLSGR